MINKVNINKWKEFSYEDFFEIISDGKKLSNKDLSDNGSTPVYSSSTSNNGCFGYTEKKADYIVDKKRPMYLIFGDHTKSMFIVKENFSIMDNVKVFIPKIINEYCIRFITTVWQKSIPNIGYARHWTIAKNIPILLPIDSTGNPDWIYMEQYMKNIEEKTKESLRRLNRCSEETNKIDIAEWRSFHLYDIFDIDSGSKMDKIAMKFDNPTINFVGRSGVNNGVTAVVDEVKDYVPYKAGNLTLALGGAYLGSCFVQEKDFYTSQNVVVLSPKEDISFYAKEFICAVIFKEGNTHYKAFIDELNRHIKTDFIIKLPVDSQGKPNYEYMDKYMVEVLNKTKNKLSCLNNI